MDGRGEVVSTSFGKSGNTVSRTTIRRSLGQIMHRIGLDSSREDDSLTKDYWLPEQEF